MADVHFTRMQRGRKSLQEANRRLVHDKHTTASYFLCFFLMFYVLYVKVFLGVFLSIFFQSFLLDARNGFW